MTSAPPRFAHLHLHSEYSILDGACRSSPLIDRIGDLGMAHVCITYHGTMAGTVELYKKAKAAGVHPVLGMEAYVTEDHRVKRRDDGTRSTTTHLTLLAANNKGWRNLMRLSSRACLEGMYYKPRIDYEMMSELGEGIICLSGCMASETQRRIMDGNIKGAGEELARLRDIFTEDRLYVEFQDNGVVEQPKINAVLEDLRKDLSLRGVITSDVHYLNHSDAKPHDALLCIQTKAKLAEPIGRDPGHRFGFSTDQFYLKSPAEMWGSLGAEGNGWPAEWFEASVEIAERCQVELKMGEFLLPEYPCPEGHTADSWLRVICEEGLNRRYPVVTDDMRRQLDFELETISNMGYSAYFLITWDWINWAKEQGIPVGPGRGSAAGSIVAYTSGITDLDPLKYGLLFERFLNPDRVSMPDIDTDIAQAGRERCIRYLTEKYGADRVAQISTFGRIAPKNAVKDAARVMDLPVAIGEKISSLIPEGPGQTFSSNLEPNADLRKQYDTDEVIRKVVDLAKPLEGMVRNTGIHAAAVVIGAEPLTQVVPLRAGEHGDQIVTQFEQNACEDLGLLKMDVLGLRNLDVLAKVIDIIERSSGKRIDLGALPLDDAETYAMIARGDCVGVFQLESAGMQAAARQIRPTCFEDIIALGALFRPGPMEYIPVYAANKHDPSRVTYKDERLRDILHETHGITVYQEQYMQIAKVLAGFTPGEADDLRKGIAKKKRDVLDRIKPKFLEGCRNNDVDPKLATKLWEDAEKAGDYSFNKSHAACYALISYQTAWLKCHYPSEYMAGLLSSVMHTKDKVPFIVNACRKMGITVLPPSVNESVHDFGVLDDGSIRFGLMAVKGVGDGAVDAIIAAREVTPFSSLWEFCERVDKTQANKRVLEALIKAGAFDETGATRKGMLDVLPQAMALGTKKQSDTAMGQFDLFSGMDEGSPESVIDYPVIPTEEFTGQELLALEKEAAGLYMSGHPIDEHRSGLDARSRHMIGQLDGLEDRTKVVVGGIIVGMRALVTKKGDPMAFIQVEGTDTAQITIVVLPKVYQHCREIIVGENASVIIKATIDAKDGRLDLIADEVIPMAVAPQLHGVTFRATASQLKDEKVVSHLRRIFSNYPGEAPVDVKVTLPDGTSEMLRLGDEWRVRLDPSLTMELRELLGDEALV